jgi:hypothetical protein
MGFLTTISAPLHRWLTMRELRALEREETHDSRFDFDGMLSDANDALERDLRSRAREIWTQTYAKFPDFAMMSEAAIDLLLRLDLFDEAEAVLNRGAKRYRPQRQTLEGLAQVAHRRGDQTEAAVFGDSHRLGQGLIREAAVVLNEIPPASS